MERLRGKLGDNWLEEALIGSREIRRRSSIEERRKILGSLHRVCTPPSLPPPPIVTISKRSVNKGSN